MVLLQVTYWLDVPLDLADPGWARAWQAEAAAAVPGIGDAATRNGRLTLRRGNDFLTIEVQGTRLDPATAAGASQQEDYEKALAQAALTRLP